jgi:hypothetical protein
MMIDRRLPTTRAVRRPSDKCSDRKSVDESGDQDIRLPLMADFVVKVGCLSFSRDVIHIGPDALYATSTLRDAQNLSGWRPGNQRCELSQVLSDGGQNKFILGASRAAQSKSTESLRMRFRCANRISIFLRSRRDCSKPSVPANDRATSRACSWMSRGILRVGSFGQHLGFSGQTSQSRLLARYRRVLPSCTVPLVLSSLPPGQ